MSAVGVGAAAAAAAAHCQRRETQEAVTGPKPPRKTWLPLGMGAALALIQRKEQQGSGGGPPSLADDKAGDTDEILFQIVIIMKSFNIYSLALQYGWAN